MMETTSRANGEVTLTSDLSQLEAKQVGSQVMPRGCQKQPSYLLGLSRLVADQRGLRGSQRAPARPWGVRTGSRSSPGQLLKRAYRDSSGGAGNNRAYDA
jgi:hypothetical protein